MNVHFVGDLKSIHFTLGGHDYAFFNGMSLTFGQAVEHCEAAGGNLASINSHTENEYIRGKIGTAHVWIGYFRDEAVIGRWNWIDGSGGYTNWDAGQPNSHASSQENCVQYYGSNGKWHDYGCDVKVAPLCKKVSLTIESSNCTVMVE